MQSLPLPDPDFGTCKVMKQDDTDEVNAATQAIQEAVGAAAQKMYAAAEEKADKAG